MKKVLKRALLLKNFVSLVRDPLQTQLIFEMTELGRELRGPLSSVTMKKVSKAEGFQDLYEQGYAPKMPSLEELLAYPQGTLGREFAEHMKENHLDIDFFPKAAGEGPEAFFVDRARKSHDLWHILTGYDAGVIGEIGLQSFSLAQLRSPISAIILAGGLLHAMLFKPEIYEDLVDAMFEGYQMGQKAKALIGLPIETYLLEDLARLRERLGVVPTTSARHESLYLKR